MDLEPPPPPKKLSNNNNPNKKYQIWSDTLLEENLCDDMKVKFDSIRKTSGDDIDNDTNIIVKEAKRDVESYNYEIVKNRKNYNKKNLKKKREILKKGNFIQKNHLSTINKLNLNLSNVKENLKNLNSNDDKLTSDRSFELLARLGPLVTYDEAKPRPHILANEFDCDELVTKEIAKHLKEPKIELIERCVKVLGRKKALEILYATEDIQAKGGMLTSEGDRYRTPGGVFIQLVRKDDAILNCQRKKIFIEDEESKRRKKNHKRLYKQKNKNIKKKSNSNDKIKETNSVELTENGAKEDLEPKRAENETNENEDDCLDKIEENQMIYFEDDD